MESGNGWDDAEPFEVDDGLENEDYVDTIDDTWHAELEDALTEGFVDQTIIKSICKCRILPPSNRPEVWKICLNIATRGNALSSWDGKLDLAEQAAIHQDCQALADLLDYTEIEEGNVDPKRDRSQVLSDLESVVTFYCKSRAVKYTQDRGWMEILRPIVEMSEFDRADIYNCFYAMIARYIPRDSQSSAQFHLFHLLLLYHDPELCTFLDSHKVKMESFARNWFQTLFAGKCQSNVVQALWDIYLQRADSFFVYFLALVILVNGKEQIMTTMMGKSKEELAEILSEYPSALQLEDVEDFSQLASYFYDKTPKSLRKDYQESLFGGSLSLSASKEGSSAETELAQMMCLQVAVPDILLSAQTKYVDGEDIDPPVQFFLVDCRSPEKYNAGHLVTAFHLDAMLMLREPTEFATAIDALLIARDQALQSGSEAGGEHLCFIGSGVEEEDQYMYMAVAHLLQRHQSYVSVARGGFKAILSYLSDVNINLKEWITGTSDPSTLLGNLDRCVGDTTESGKVTPPTKVKKKQSNDQSVVEGFMKNLSLSLKTKSSTIKEKVTRFIENVDPDANQHVNAGQRSRAYRGTQPVFSIGDDDHSMDEMKHDERPSTSRHHHPISEESDVDDEGLIDYDPWVNRSQVKTVIECFWVTKEGKKKTAHLAIEGEDLVCLREYKKKHKCKIISRRQLVTVSKITSKRSLPELISFKFGAAEEPQEEGEKEPQKAPQLEVERYLIPDAGQVTKKIKQEIMKVLERAEAPKT